MRTSTFRFAKAVEIRKTLSEGWMLVDKYLKTIREASMVTFGHTRRVNGGSARFRPA